VIRRPQESYAAYLRGCSEPLRIGWSAMPLLDHPVDLEVARTVEATAKTLAGLGHHVEESAPRFDLTALDTHLTAIWYFQYDRYLDDLGARAGRKVGPDTVEPMTLKFYEWSKTCSADSYFRALAALNGYRRQIGRWFEHYDIWLTPTCAEVAAPRGRYGMNIDVKPEEFLRHEQRPCQFMVWANVCGAPALSLPLGQHSNGLPIGVQLGARPGHEENLIALGAELERAMPWAARLPGAHVTRLTNQDVRKMALEGAGA
jgi:amidase